MRYYFLLFLLPFLEQQMYTDLYTIYAHGIVDNPAQIKRFKQAIATDHEHTKSVIFPDTQKETGYGINRMISEITTLINKPINRSKMYMGTGADIQAIDTILHTIHQNNDLILYGCSRGGTALINYLAQHNPDHIAAIILDATPAHMPATIHPILAKIGIHSSYDETIFSTLFPAYLKDSTGSKQLISKIKNKNIPILLIHSQNDTKVSYDHSLLLYQEFKQNGFKNVYLATIPSGKHSFLLQDVHANAVYLQAVHSFYKHFGLPYNSQWAQDNLEQYQPTLDKVQEQITECAKALTKEYEQSKQRNIIGASLIAMILISYLLYKKFEHL